ncbi:MAG: InlB B-repeat-containing protein [Gammaproteobacteria bacterium]|nr:InlB B-repeat-containing protein [Gammaproteobacteria bacterium]
MKKKSIFLIIILLVMSAFCLTACKQGNPGVQGEPGDKGPNGLPGTDGVDGENGEDGENAKAPIFRVTKENGIQYKLGEDGTWVTLVSMEDLVAYKNKYTVTYNVNGGTAIAPVKNIVYKTDVTLPVAINGSYEFLGWKTADSDTIYTETYKVLGDTVLNAVYASNIYFNPTSGQNFAEGELTQFAQFGIGKYGEGGDGKILTIGDPKKLSSNKWWSRVFLKTIDASQNLYQIVGGAADGIDFPAINYDFLIGAHSAATDKAARATVMELCNAKYFGYVVKLEGFTPDALEVGAIEVTATVYSRNHSTKVLYGQTYTLPTSTDPNFLGYTMDKVHAISGDVVPTGSTVFNILNKYTINYVLGDENATGVPASEEIDTVEKANAELVTPSCDGKVFKGWFYDAEFTKPCIVRPLNSATLYAKFAAPTKVTYVFDGGVPYYETREAMVDDFLKDAMEKYGVTSKPNCMHVTNGVPTDGSTVENPVGFANVFSAIYGMFADSRYAYKWCWMRTYILSVSDSTSSLSALQTGDESAWRYAIGAFLFKTQRTTYPKSANFTTDEMANGYTLSFYGESVALEYYVASSTITAIAKEGYTFDGWYDGDGNKVTEIAETSTYKEITLTARWTLIE